jgi:hypothetical protein
VNIRTFEAFVLHFDTHNPKHNSNVHSGMVGFSSTGQCKLQALSFMKVHSAPKFIRQCVILFHTFPLSLPFTVSFKQ